MLNIDSLAGAEVLGDVVAKRDGAGEDSPQKRNREGLPGWVVTVIIPKMGGRLTDSQRVTVWSEKRPKVADGDRVNFGGIAVGAYSAGGNAGLYVWANSVEIADDVDREIDSILGDLSE